MIEHLLEYDTQLFLFLNNLGSPTWDNFWLAVTHEITFVPLYAILLFLLYRKFGIKALLVIMVLTALMIAFTDQMANAFKRFFERPRPCGEAALIDHMRFIAVRCGKYGFFSGHSSNSMTAAVFVGLLLRPYYKNLLLILVLWSAMVGYSRIYVGVHYPIDVIFGLIFGAISGVVFYKFAQYLIGRFVAN
ncbi:phosphatase PAP2 family protein [Mariniflexile sp.]|uniref:phosphatase PAP2 family protein n=2 Tax=Mariniflexile sp. TaxID=1979402 RepID=UPI0040473AB9